MLLIIYRRKKKEFQRKKKKYMTTLWSIEVYTIMAGAFGTGIWKTNMFLSNEQ